MTQFNQWLSEREPVWKRLEETLAENQSRFRGVNPQAIRSLCLAYRGVASDLARAQSSPQYAYLAPYLNNLTQRLHGVTFETPPAHWRGVYHFIAYELPRCFRRNHYFVWVAFLTFCLGALIAGATVALNPSAETFFLPSAMIDQVAQGRLWVDDVEAAPSKSSFLMTNNIRVAFQAYVGGLFWGVGSLFALFYNGIFAFGGPLAVCMRYNMGLPLLLFMIPHGVIELSTIFIAGAAGMIVGHALLFPGENPRWAYVYSRVRESLILVAGCVGLLVIAGLIEGMVSLNKTLPVWMRVGISASSGVLLFAYLAGAGRSAHALRAHEDDSL